MHELGIVQGVVEAAEERSEGRKILRLVMEIGRGSGVLPDAVRFAWDVATEGTLAEGATLEIVELPGSGVKVVRMEVS
jgi:hydrogenase nickel incorporation protein HypA/HybF